MRPRTAALPRCSGGHSTGSPVGCGKLDVPCTTTTPPMNESQRSTVSALFSLAITLAALFVTQRFILPLAWAAIICIATWPLYLWILARCRHSHVLASSVAVLISALVFVAPLAIAFQQILVQA